MSTDRHPSPAHSRRRPAHRVRAAAVVGLLLAVGLGACGDGDDSSGSTPSAPQTGATTTADGDAGATPGFAADQVAELEAPIVLLPRPGDDDHLYVAERAGHVRRLTRGADGALTEEGDVLLDLTDQTSTDGERGLLGLAFSADGDTIYVSHTDADGNTRLASYAMDGDAIDAASREVLLAVDQPFPNHNGGNVVLGPDGLLWFGLGDGGSGDDPGNRAQDLEDPLGKVLRIDPATGERELVVHGVRNPWRFAFDDDGSLWIGDVGQESWEEVDHLAADEIEGANLGWSAREGTHDNDAVDPEGRRGDDPIDPVFEYAHEGGNCSITGGFPYHGKALPALEGAYLFADYCAGRVRAITLDDDGAFDRELDLGIDVEQPISFGTDQDGEAYVLSDAGPIVRITAAS